MLRRATERVSQRLAPRRPGAAARTLRWLLVVAWQAACAPGPAPARAPAPAVAPKQAAASPRSLPAADPADTAVAVGIHGAVTSAEAHASAVGLEVLRAGGNAVDAAIAVGFALAVTHPSAGNVGGGGFMVVRMADGRTTAIDYREAAPAAAHRDMYLDKSGNPDGSSLLGPRAAGIPGTVAGLALAHGRFGTRAWAELVKPAIGLAAEGHPIDADHAESMASALERMKKAGFSESVRIYGKPDGGPYAAGDRWAQPELAATLRIVAERGPRAFYEGELASRLAAGTKAAGGLWTEADLAGYRAIERKPVEFDYRGHHVITMPPPSAGGVVLRQILAASELLDLAAKPWHSVEEVHLYVEAARRTYADRNMLLADPDFVKMPIDRLLAVDYVRGRLASIDPRKATPSSSVAAGVAGKRESEQTTHYSVVDDAGNAVATTYTLNTGFGSKFVVPGTGVMLNNEMDDFAVKPGSPNAYGLVQGEQNRIEPGKRMLSSMTPTIVTKDGKLRAVVGSPGGSTISTTVAQIVRALVDYGVPIDDAVEAVRIHHQWLPDAIFTEARIDPELEADLRALGHDIKKRDTMGHAHCIEVDPKTSGYRAVADVTRGGGKAVAY